MMKKTILLAILAITAFMPSFAQEADKPESKSNTVLFEERGNSLIERTFYDIGAIPGLEFQCITIKNVQDGEMVGALRVITHYYNNVLKDTEEFIGTIDSDEMDALIKALEYMNEIATTKEATDIITEYEFRSRDDVRFCLFTTRRKTWELVVKPLPYRSHSSWYIKKSRLTDITELAKKSKAQLDEALGGQP